MILWIVEGGEDERCVCRCWRKGANGEIEGSVVVDEREGCAERGTKWMGEGEGIVRRLERSNVWQNGADDAGFSVCQISVPVLIKIMHELSGQ